MSYSPFKVGTVVTNETMRYAFKIGNMGGMCKSNTYNCLVLISDHTKGLYDDKWYGTELHYTGMGQEGDQTIRGNQNATLFHSKTNGIDVHLFEVIEKGEYTYRGIVKLTGEPYQEIQPDKNGNLRNVWMFPITPISGAPEYSKEKLDSIHEKNKAHAEKLSLKELENIAQTRSSKNPSIKKVIAIQRDRDEYISEYTKQRSNGICQLCDRPAPFKDKTGKPYLESHHIVWLSKGGEDTIENCVALCPNCHKKMHIINDVKDIEKLKRKNTNL